MASTPAANQAAARMRRRRKSPIHFILPELVLDIISPLPATPPPGTGGQYGSTAGGEPPARQSAARMGGLAVGTCCACFLCLALVLGAIVAAGLLSSPSPAKSPSPTAAPRVTQGPTKSSSSAPTSGPAGFASPSFVSKPAMPWISGKTFLDDRDSHGTEDEHFEVSPKKKE